MARVRVAYEPGKQCSVLYSLRFGDAPEDSSRWVVVTFAADDGLRKAYKHYYGNGAGDSGGRANASAVYVPEHRCLVEFFPFDWKLPHLVRATNAAEMASAAGFPDGGSALRAGQGETETLRYVPHKRCVFRLGVHSPEGDNIVKRVVVKVYPPGPLARQTWRALSTLHSQAAAGGILVPRPVKMLDRWNLVVMEEAPGTSLKNVLKRVKTPEEAGALVGRAATALATLHTLRFESRQVRSFENYLEFLRDEALRVQPVAPLLARQAQALLRKVARIQFPRAAAPPCLIHGDFAPSQLLIAEDRVAVVDFDNACLGDPAMDLGNFMAKLHRRAAAKGKDYHRRLSQQFLTKYSEHVRDEALEERARLYQVLTLVRSALHTFRRAPPSYAREGPASLPVRLLQEAATCLAA